MKELDLYIRYHLSLKPDESIPSLIKSFKELSDVSQPQNVRRAAFLCYTTLANIIKQEHEKLIKEYHNENFFKDISSLIYSIIQNLLINFKDNDSKIVCSAAESLYNIMKYFPELVINYFNEIFEGLLLVNVNQDQEVRTLAQNLDSSLKEIVNYSFQDNKLPNDLNLKEFLSR